MRAGNLERVLEDVCAPFRGITALPEVVVNQSGVA
jgi:hypothetical protein